MDADDDTETVGRPREVLAKPEDSAGPWSLFYAKSAPMFLRFKVAAQSEDRTVTSPWSALSQRVVVGELRGRPLGPLRLPGMMRMLDVMPLGCDAKQPAPRPPGRACF